MPCTRCQSNNVRCIAQLRSFEKGEQNPLQSCDGKRLPSQQIQKHSARQTQYLLFEQTRQTRALQILYKQSLSGLPWQGEPVTDIHSEGPSIHEILQRLEGHISVPALPNSLINELDPGFNLRWAASDRKAYAIR